MTTYQEIRVWVVTNETPEVADKVCGWLEIVADRWGGYTIQEATGAWRSPTTGKLITDQVLLVTILTPEARDIVDQWCQQECGYLAEVLGEETVLYTLTDVGVGFVSARPTVAATPTEG